MDTVKLDEMTKEEACAVLDDMKVKIDIPHAAVMQRKRNEALDMAISALSTEGEYIKKSELLQHVTTEELSDFKDCDVIHAEEIDELPTYSFPNSAENKGEWKMPIQDDGMSDPIYYQVRCSKCGFDLDPQTWHQELHQYGADNFCPNCGADMRGGKGK